jgi:hypothetical protein
MTWTREHDRIIAEKCQGLRVVVDRHAYWVTDDRGLWEPLPQYCAYLPHTVRAAEAWRKQDEEARSWSISSPEYGDAGMRGICYNGRPSDWRTKSAYSEQPAAALAHALYQAVAG